MKVRQISEEQDATYVLVLDPGEEVIETIERFAEEHELVGCSFTGIGAFEFVSLGYFDPNWRDYRRRRFREQVEVLSLIGNIAMSDGKPKLHAHVVVGRFDGSAYGGHLMQGTVRPTLEVILRKTPAHLRREFNPQVGLPLLKP